MKQFLYLRTDICTKDITEGGSIGHTLGVLQGFHATQNYKALVFASAMKNVLKQQQNLEYRPLRVVPFFLLRWKLNYLRWRLESFFSTFIFAAQILFRTGQSYNFVYQRYSILNFTGLCISRLKKVPFILEYNGSEAYWFDLAKSHAWYEKYCSLQKLSYLVEDLNLAKADCIVAVSAALKDDLIARGVDEQKILVNPNGVDAEVFKATRYESERSMLRKQYGIEDKYVFGFIGTFGFWHGITLLEKLIPLLVARASDVHFLLIGEGMLKEQLEDACLQAGVEHFVTFVGKIAQDKAPEYLAACDAFLCPTQPNPDGSRFFGSPTKLFEYMSMGKPILASDLEQLSEVISPAIRIKDGQQTITITNQVGFLVSPTEVQEWVAACIACIGLSKEEKNQLGINARQKVLENYTWKQHVQRIIEHAGL